MRAAPLPNPPAGESPVAWPDAQRRSAFERWLAGIAPRHGLDATTLRPASADASFRRYLRLQGTGGTPFIVMDAPPALEDSRPFLKVAALAAAAGLNVPTVHEADAEQGFLLLSDLGRRLYLDALREASAAERDRLMRDAALALVQWQAGVDASDLPPYDQALLQAELDLFPTWCVQRKFGITWTEKEQDAWKQLTTVLMGNALNTPAVAVHADWMPRNLMVCEPGRPGILDFQDAVRGPLTYDLASLLRDAFISWEEEQEIDWAVRYWQAARKAGLPVPDDFGAFWQSLEWMGLHRHLRVIGIFCRLEQRDGKAQYAADLPRFFNYALKVAMRYRPLAPLVPLLEPMSGQALQSGFTF